MKRLKFLIHLFVFTFFLPSFDCNMNVEKALSSKKKESDLLEELKVWVDDIIQGPLPKYCHGPPEDTIKNDEYLIRSAPCHEKDAIKRYDFDGTFVNGKINGNGVLTISPESPLQHKCIIVKSSVFDLPSPDKIEGEFQEGYVFGIANLTWTDLDIKITSHVSYGMLHGMFKAYDGKTNKWMISTAHRSQLGSSVGCWIVSPDYVLSTTCNGVFKIIDKKIMEHMERKITVFLFDMTVVLQGVFKDDSTSVLIERDAILKNVMKIGVCEQNIYAEEVGSLYEFDLNTGIRKLKDYQYYDLCNGTETVEGDKVSEFLRTYLTRMLGPIILDKEEENQIDHTKDKTKLISNIRKHPMRPNQTRMYDASFSLFKEEEITFQHNGNLDEHGNFHGYTMLKVLPSVSCIKGSCNPDDIGQIRGTFNHGNMEGLVSVTSQLNKPDKEMESIVTNKKSEPEDIQHTFIPTKEGMAHGMVMTFGMKQLYKVRENPNPDFKPKQVRNPGLGRLAKFQNGKLTNDFAWQSLTGVPDGQQGFMYGQFDNDGKMTGDEVGYIYPGAKLALVGKFKSNVMVAGQRADIIQATCKNNMLSVKFGKPDGPKFHLSLGTNNSVGDMPLVADPYETMTIKIDKSSIPNSGEGLVAVRDIEAYELLALYSGFHLVGLTETNQHYSDCHNKTWPHNLPKGDELMVKKACFKNKLHSLFGDMLDIPPWWDFRSYYNATLAHMVNNRFEPNINCKFGAMEHPRFGPIETVWATKKIKKGEELFLDYGYSSKGFGKGSNANELFPWYEAQFLANQEYLKKKEAGEDVSHLPIP